MTTDRSDVDRARSELAATVEAIEYKLNVPKRASESIERLRKDNPIALAGIAVGVAVTIAGTVWGIVRLIRR
jgi:tellurite resistance protein